MTFQGGPVNEIENPNPVPGTNNWWIQDGYGGFGNNGSSTGVYGGGSYSNCSDPSQPGVGPILSYLESVHIKPNCDPGHYYLLNNYNPGYFGDGTNAYTDTNPHNTPFTIPPTSQRSIADVSGGGRNVRSGRVASRACVVCVVALAPDVSPRVGAHDRAGTTLSRGEDRTQ